MNMKDEKHQPEYEICLCRHVTRGQVEKIIRDKGIRDIDVLCREANVGNKCGGCREDLAMLLDEIW